MVPYFAGSFQPGTTPEQIVVRTSAAVPDLRGDWYLGVYNNQLTNDVAYTIRAILPEGGILVSALPTGGHKPGLCLRLRPALLVLDCRRLVHGESGPTTSPLRTPWPTCWPRRRSPMWLAPALTSRLLHRHPQPRGRPRCVRN